MTLRRLLAMPEFQREDILAQRQEEMQRLTDKRQLEMMVQQQSGRGQGEDNVSSAAKRMCPLPRPSHFLTSGRRATRCSGSDEGEEQEAG